MANSNTIEITSKIVEFTFLGDVKNEKQTTIEPLQVLSESTKRPMVLEGKTYKLESPIYEAAMYITINDIVLNPGTDQESRKPFEIFINSKAMESFQWIVSLTRMISAVFRKGGDVAFVVEQLKSICDPRGGYWKKGKYISSIVVEIAMVIEDHLISLGMIQQEIVEKPKVSTVDVPLEVKSLRHCPSCGAPGLIRESNCDKCLNCNWSKCS